MDLKKLPGKKIRLVSKTTGKVYLGYASDYIFPEDNEPEGIAAIGIDNPIIDGRKSDMLIDFNENEIASIEIIE